MWPIPRMRSTRLKQRPARRPWLVTFFLPTTTALQNLGPASTACISTCIFVSLDRRLRTKKRHSTRFRIRGPKPAGGSAHPQGRVSFPGGNYAIGTCCRHIFVRPPGYRRGCPKRFRQSGHEPAHWATIERGRDKHTGVTKHKALTHHNTIADSMVPRGATFE